MTPPEGLSARRSAAIRWWARLAGPVMAAAAAVAVLGAVSAFVDAPGVFASVWGTWVARAAATAGLVGAGAMVLVVVLAVIGLIARVPARRWWALVAPPLLLAAGVVLVVPGGVYPCLPAGDAGAAGPALRVMSANVLMTNTDGGRGLAAEIAAVDPDVLVLAETGPVTDAALAPVLARYDYGLVSSPYPDNPSAGLSLYAKAPLTGTEVLDDGPRPVLRAVLDLDGHPVTVLAFHPSAPIGQEWTTNWIGEIQALSGDIPADGPVVIAGDFNATVAHAPFRALLAEHRLRDVTGGAPTWPQHGYPIPLAGIDGPLLAAPVPPLIGLDHVLTRGFVTRAVSLGQGAGSDHRPVIAEVVLEGPAGS